MKTFLVSIAILISCSLAGAGEYIIQSQFPDVQPGDGIFDAGSPFNPMIIIDSDTGEEVGTMSTDFIDVQPGDGIGEAGSMFNPYRVIWDD